MKKIIAFLLSLLPVAATTLTGTLAGPNGAGATGTLIFSLSQQAALQSTGSCGGTAEILPNTLIRISVINGVMQSPPAIYGNDCMLPSGTFYLVQFMDANGNVLMNDRWQITGSSIDIGSIVSVVVAGTTTSLGGGVVFTLPAGAQTIAQPGATTLNVNNLAVTNVLTAPGGLTCSVALTQCGFSNGVALNGGFTTPPGSNSLLFMGTGGAFYNHTFGGLDATCTGITDGWMGWRTDSQQLETCQGGTVYKSQFNTSNILKVGSTTVIDAGLNLININQGTFNSAITANGGISTNVASNSQIYIGTGGNFFMRTYSGTNPSCTGIQDGWFAVRIDTQQLQFCAGGVLISK